ncbi:MAG: SurA N-terminal domain-containing protein [Verrucomicrobiae bacterium]|nr:SurA N-terminal domain-containing protein [Verrucomicrobiae bacterium]NNJ43213.1 hypothetical protein [Akkermansiaceae bacterium]
MIENMRKYTVLMAVVFVLLGAGFLFTMNNGTSSRGGGSGPTVLEVYDRVLDQQEYRRMGDATLQLASDAGLHNYVNFLMVPDIRQLQQAMQLMRYGYPNYYVTMGRNLTTQDFNRFVANRIILQRAMDEMGIYASEEEITETLKTSQRFAPGGKYDAGAYSTFVEKRLGKLGMTEKYLREIVRESLCLNQLINIVGGGLIPPRSGVRDQLEAQAQTVTLARIVFNRDDFVEKENPTEEEIKAYWEAHQDAYQTEEKRRIHYLLLDIPEEEKKEDNKSADAATPASTDPAVAAKDAAEKAKKEADAKAVKEEARLKASRALRREIDEIAQEIDDNFNDKKPLDLAAILTKRNHSLVETKLFDSHNLPKELADLTLRGNVNRGRTLSQLIFSTRQSTDPYDLISDPLPVGDDGWLIFTLEETITPVLLDYATARNKARAQLIAENADRKVKVATKEARDAIVAIMESGKTFDEAAKEKSLVPVQIGPFSATGTAPKDEPSYQVLHRTASGLNPGDVSEPIDENDRSLFIYVDQRELEDTEENKNRIDNTLKATKSDLMMLTFLNWINHQYQNAGVKGAATEEE